MTFSGRWIENKIFWHQHQNIRHENNINFEPRIYESYHQRKTFWEIFATFNFVLVILAAQVNRKIESDFAFSGRRDQVTTACLLAKLWSICVKWWRVIGFFLLLVFYFFQRLTRNVRIQRKDHNRPSQEVDQCFCKVKNLLSKTRLFITR